MGCDLFNSSDYICEGVDLSGVEIVEQDRRFVKQARKEVETQAQKMLEQGMETQVTFYRVKGSAFKHKKLY